jgi:hypothetical protein
MRSVAALQAQGRDDEEDGSGDEEEGATHVHAALFLGPAPREAVEASWTFTASPASQMR